MMSAVIALEVIWLPQLGPVNWTLMALWLTLNAFSSAAWTVWVACDVSWPVVTCQRCGPDRYCARESPPPAAVTARVMSPWDADAAAGNWKTDPPLNSTLKFSPRISRAPPLTIKMMPEIAYHIFWRP